MLISTRIQRGLNGWANRKDEVELLEITSQMHEVNLGVLRLEALYESGVMTDSDLIKLFKAARSIEDE